MIKILLISLFALPFITYGQGDVTGGWKLDLSGSLENGVSRVSYDSLPAATKARISERFGSRTFTFQSDGTVQISWTQGNDVKGVSGEYWFDAEKKSLDIRISDRMTRFNVLLLTTSELVLEYPSGVGLFDRLYLKKTD